MIPNGSFQYTFHLWFALNCYNIALYLTFKFNVKHDINANSETKLKAWNGSLFEEDYIMYYKKS